MKTRALFAKIAGLSLVALGLMSQVVWAQGNSGNQPSFVPGRILVKFKDGVSDGQARGLLAGRGALSTDLIPGIGVHIVQLPPNANEQAEANAFKGLADVEFAEVDQILQPQSINPNDPFYTTGNQWALPKISLPDAWSATTGSASVRIAIVDSGIQSNHPDLLANVTTGYNSTTGTADTTDVNNHGSEVAGVVAASTNNGLGVAGVCWRCILVPVKVTDFTGAATASSIANGIIWAVDFGGARVVNASYRVNGSTTIASAADHVWQVGGILVMAAGDTATSYTFPDNAHILEIGATDQNDVLYSWSSTGPYVDLVAPGCVTSTNALSSYASNCGTSFSAPLVAGVAGLMLSINPGLTPTQIVSILKQTAVDLGPAGCDASYGCGRLNALAAVTAAVGGGSTKTNTTTALSSSLNPSTPGQLVTFTATVSPSTATGTVTFNDGATTLGTGTLSSGRATFSTSTLAAGSHSISASYGGSTSYNASTSAILTETLNSTSKTNTTTALGSSLNPSSSGQTVTFTATVSPSTATGTVTFFDGSTSLGSGTLSSGRATLSTASLTAGTHSVTASYGGNTSYNGSGSAILLQTVNTVTSNNKGHKGHP